MAGDGRSTDDITMPLLFLFHKEGNILLEALKEYRQVEVLLSDKARDRGTVKLLTSSKFRRLTEKKRMNSKSDYIKKRFNL